MTDRFGDWGFWLGRSGHESLAWLLFAAGYGLLMGALQAPVTARIAGSNGFPAGFVVNPGFWLPLVMLPAMIATYRNDGVIVGFVLVGSPTIAMFAATTLWPPGMYYNPRLSTQLLRASGFSLISGGLAVVLGSGSRRLYKWYVVGGWI